MPTKAMSVILSNVALQRRILMKSSTSTISETILNTVPAISSVTIQSSTGLYNDSVVECVATVDDPDEIVTPSFIWQVAGGVVGTQVAHWI